MRISHTQPGYSLVEVLLYFALAGAIMAAALNFMIQISTIKGLSQNIQEVSYTSSELLENLQRAVFEAQSVDDVLSVWDNDQGALSLVMPDAGVSPTRFYYENGNVMMKQGNGVAVALNTTFTKVDSLRFHRITSYKNPDQIVVDAVITNANSDFENQNHSILLHSTLSLRSL